MVEALFLFPSGKELLPHSIFHEDNVWRAKIIGQCCSETVTVAGAGLVVIVADQKRMLCSSVGGVSAARRSKV